MAFWPWIVSSCAWQGCKAVTQQKLSVVPLKTTAFDYITIYSSAYMKISLTFEVETQKDRQTPKAHVSGTQIYF